MRTTRGKIAPEPCGRIIAEASEKQTHDAAVKEFVHAHSVADMLERTTRHYKNRGVETVQIVEKLIQLVHEMREANARDDTMKRFVTLPVSW